jgi:hypothetical protein
MYAVATGRAERNPAADLRGAIPRPSVKHMASILDPSKVGILIISEWQQRHNFRNFHEKSGEDSICM